jgi:hypothetical protein
MQRHAAGPLSHTVGLVAARDIPGALTNPHGKDGGAHAFAPTRTIFELDEQAVGNARRDARERKRAEMPAVLKLMLRDQAQHGVVGPPRPLRQFAIPGRRLEKRDHPIERVWQEPFARRRRTARAPFVELGV